MNRSEPCEAGSAYNAFPDTARFGGTLRIPKDRVRELAQSIVRDTCHGSLMAHGIRIDIQFREIFDVLINNGEAADTLMAAAPESLARRRSVTTNVYLAVRKTSSTCCTRVPALMGG